MDTLQVIREFKTAQFQVILDAIVEDCPDLSWDETGEIARQIDNGDLVIFCTRARVIHADSDDFMHIECGVQTRQLRDEGSTAPCGSYFGDIVAEAMLEGMRQPVIAIKLIYVRE